MGKFQDLTGRVFGSRTVLHRLPNSDTGHTRWLCRCACGDESPAYAANLVRGRSNRCAVCGLKDMRGQGGGDRTHGLCGERLYTTWSNMVQRCENPRHPMFRYYGAKGVCICRAWRGFEGFYAWAKSSGYRDDLTIERRDSNGNYEPSNCEWITLSENSRRGAVSQWTTRQKTEASAAAG